MGNCKDCKYWVITKDWKDAGYCQKLTSAMGLLVERVRGGTRFLTKAEFGCVHFEQKPKGPFRIVEVRDGSSGSLYIACGSHKSPLGFFHKDVIEMFVNWLNDLWEQKKCEWTGPVCPDCTRHKLERSYEYWKHL